MVAPVPSSAASPVVGQTTASGHPETEPRPPSPDITGADPQQVKTDLQRVVQARDQSSLAEWVQVATLNVGDHHASKNSPATIEASRDPDIRPETTVVVSDTTSVPRERWSDVLERREAAPFFTWRFDRFERELPFEETSWEPGSYEPITFRPAQYVGDMSAVSLERLVTVREGASEPVRFAPASTRRVLLKFFDVHRSSDEGDPSMVLITLPNGEQKKIVLEPGNSEQVVEVPAGDIQVTAQAGKTGPASKGKKDERDNFRVEIYEERSASTPPAGITA